MVNLEVHCEPVYHKLNIKEMEDNCIKDLTPYFTDAKIKG
jgi:hypothetical protein